MRLPGALLLALASRLAWGQDPQGVSLGPPDPIFPSDTQDPKLAGGAQLLEAVCPGSVAVGEKIGCKGDCPSFTGLGEGLSGWELIGVTRGRFLSMFSDDAVLSMSGCEPHSENFGGTILLTRGSEGWKMVWYKAGVDTSKCHRVSVENPREILVCVGSFGGQGNLWTELFAEDLLAPSPALMVGNGRDFFGVADNTNAFDCGREFDGQPEPKRRGGIDKVEFGKGANGGPLVMVTASMGKKWLTQEEIETCEDMRSGVKPRHELDIFPVTKSYHLEFFFDGDDFKPTSESVAQLFR